jgi:hypothetical protein
MISDTLGELSKQIRFMEFAGEGLANALLNFVGKCRCDPKKLCTNCETAQRAFKNWEKVK